MSNLQPGQMLGPYQIIGQIGKGGMATVYKAYHANMDRYVAVKVLALQFAQSEEFLGRFQQEAHLIARLEHPHILPVYDSGESDHMPYLVMRYLEAGTLKDRLTAGALSRDEIDRLFTQLADALVYAHENGVIHRDMKPSNVMLDKRGNIFLTDFGIAKLVEGSPQFTATGAVTGTPDYMSPEQAQGGKVDQRADIYALGVILYEMLTGRVPYEAETPLAVILKKIQEPLPPPTSINPSIPAELEAVVLKALARDPADRFQSTRAFLEAWKRGIALVTPTYIPVPAAQPAAEIPSATRLPSQQGIAPAPLPAAPTRPHKPIMLIAGLSCAGLVAFATIAVIIFIIATNLQSRGEKTKLASSVTESALPTQRATATEILRIPESSPTFAVPPTRMPTALPASAVALPMVSPARDDWQSWAAGNYIYTIFVQGKEILAGSQGSLIIWNRQDGSFRQITARDGLPGASVKAVFCDTDGTWWFGTDGGLAHFDGSHWEYYSYDQGLDSTEVTAITRVGGELWAGTNYSGVEHGGLLYFDGQRWQPVSGFPSTEEGRTDTVAYNVNAIVEDLDGRVWVATSDGLAMFDGQSWHVFDTPQGLPDPIVTTLTLDAQGKLWVGTYHGGALWFDGDKLESLADLSEIGDVQGIVQDAEGNYWFSGYKLARYTPQTGDWTYFNPDETLPVSDLSAAVRDEQGVLYFGTFGGGLLRYDGQFSVWRVPDVPWGGSFSDSLAAPDGKLWFLQSNSTDVDQLDPATGVWDRVGLGEECCPIPYMWDAQGNLWAGGEQGLWVLDPSRQVKTRINTEQGLPNDQVTAIVLAPDGAAWVGTQAGLATVQDGQIKDVYNTSNSPMASNFVTTLFIASDGSLWVGVENGLSMRKPDGSWLSFAKGDVFGEDLYWIMDIAQDAQGALWMATLSDGIYRYADGDWQHFSNSELGAALPVNGVNSLASAPDGSLWFGLEWGGAVQLHPDGLTWTHYGLQDGLIHPNVTDVTITPDGVVWFATGGGISRYTPPVAAILPTVTPSLPVEVTTPGNAAAMGGLACFGSFDHGMTCLDENGWHPMTEENGTIGNDMVSDLAVCPDNLLIIAQLMGLNTFDGNTWKIFGQDWGYNSPEAVVCDANDGIWLAHFDGVSYFDGQTWTTYPAEQLATGESANKLLKDIALAPDGKVWAMTANSVAFFDDGQWTIFQQGQGFSDLTFFETLAIDNQGNVWVSHSMGIEKYDGQQWNKIGDPGISVVQSLVFDASDRLWVGTHSQGIYILEKGSWIHYTRDNSGLNSDSIYSIAFDAAGRAWIVTEYGLNILDGENWYTYRMDNAELVDNDLRVVAVTGNGPPLPAPVEKGIGSIIARLVDSSGQPLANTTVEICVESIGIFYSGASPCAGQPFSVQVTTDGDGYFTATDLPESYYGIAVKYGDKWVRMTNSLGISSERVLVRAGDQKDLGTITIEEN
jgi:ligand-binding sensor domain-containing protein